jgi:lycopene cyclase CruA
MKLTYSDYLELPAPLPIAAAALRDPAAWAAAFGAERLGELWRWRGELYTLTIAEGGAATPTFCWQAEPAAGGGPRLAATLTLSDAVISAHAALQVTVEAPGLPWPGRGMRLRSGLRRAARAAASALAALLREQEVAVPALRPVAVGVAVAPDGQEMRDDEDPPLDLAHLSPQQRALVERLGASYPLTVGHFLAMGALDHLERAERLEQGWERIIRGEYDRGAHELVPELPPLPAEQRFDLIYAGAGLGLLHAAVMAARHGRRVLLFDRSEVGCAHREWNISRAELERLVATGVVSWEELSAVVMREYCDGLVRFHNRPGSPMPPADLWLPAVLNVAVDAAGLLRLMRRKLEAAGGTVLSGRAFRAVRATASGPVAVEVELEQLATGATERYGARLLLDGMGSTSPLALYRHAGRPFAGVCPTVGTVATGFARGDGPGEYDPTRGDILLSMADAQRGEQLMWEGFPGRGDELTVYLFYYSTLETAGRPSPLSGLRPDAPRYSLLDLFEQYFILLPSYKRPGPGFRHLRPVYGYIPARHSIRRQEAPLLRGVLPVGDSAAQQSPLTFCGFGSHVRNLRRTTGLLEHALRHDLLTPAELASVNAYQINVSLNWVFSRFMHPWAAPDDVNRLQNLFYEVLRSDLGVERATRYFRDQMRWRDYYPMLFGMLRRRPQILVDSWAVLTPLGIWRWFADYAHFTAAAVVAAGARTVGPAGERIATALADAVSLTLGLRVRSAYEEWRAMGWV